MSRQSLRVARNRLKRAKEEVLWAIAVLEDPSANLERYNLSQDEVEELFQEFHADLTDIQTAIAQLLSQRRHIQVEDKTVKMVGPIPPWLSNLESVGPIIPWSSDEESKSSRTSRRIGENKANQREGSVGPIPPYYTGPMPPSTGPIPPYYTGPIKPSTGPIKPYKSKRRASLREHPGE